MFPSVKALSTVCIDSEQPSIQFGISVVEIWVIAGIGALLEIFKLFFKLI